ncbi:cell division protein FtsL [Caryophanon latum]|uniref:Cell division protein FtsL n=1 Tax=Caryophanon latum TaxID=33977 RepID=A0A1C0YW65_9BACL|nr:cell division protein FtsL [Caryophanon latum]OCS91419.1 cell division protein FtsL [Caryophanon latum]
MALRAPQPQYEPQQPRHDEQHQSRQLKDGKKYGWFHITPGEKGIAAFLCIILAITIGMNLSAQSSVQQTNIKISQTEAEISKISDENEELYVQVSELSRYERIWERAQALGLTQNEQNVRVVPGQ